VNVLRTVAAVREWRASAGRVGLVPTRGGLHEGQSALVDRAIRQNDAAIVSIVVARGELGPAGDAVLRRSEDADLALIEKLGAAAAFIPTVD
jgi:pantoate--beta-alanine ligase